MSSSRLFRACCIAFIGGIAGASFAPVSWLTFTHPLFFFAVLMLALGWGMRTRLHVPGWGHVFLLVAGCAVFGIWRYALSVETVDPSHVAYYNGQHVTMTGAVVSEIERTNQRQRMRLGAIAISEPAVGVMRGQLLATVPRYPEYAYGDRLELTCTLQAPEAFDGFAYNRYLARHGIYSTCWYPSVALVQPHAGSSSRLYAALLQGKQSIASVIDRALPEPEASVVQAMVLGYRERLSDEWRDIFARAGVSHIIAISGMHIAIVAGGVVYTLLAIGLWRRQALWLGLVLVWGYILGIGLPASAVRAGVMASVVVVAMHWGRPNVTLRALLYAAVILLIVNPRLMRDDVGFQLSFLAVAGIAGAYPWWVRTRLWLKGLIPGPRALRQLLAGVGDVLYITIAAQLLTLPVIAWHFGFVSVGGVVTNLLVVWLVPAIIVSSVVAVPLAYILPSLGWLWFAPAYGLTRYVTHAAMFVSAHGSIYTVNDVSWPAIVLYYAAVVGAWWWLRTREQKMAPRRVLKKI